MYLTCFKWIHKNLLCEKGNYGPMFINKNRILCFKKPSAIKHVHKYINTYTFYIHIHIHFIHLSFLEDPTLKRTVQLLLIY